jgi:hypothetical protein
LSATPPLSRDGAASRAATHAAGAASFRGSLDEIERLAFLFVERVHDATSSPPESTAAPGDATDPPGDSTTAAAEARRRLESLLRQADVLVVRTPGRSGTLTVDLAAIAAWAVLGAMRRVDRETNGRTAATWFHELRLAPIVAEAMRAAGLDEGRAWEVVATLRVLLSLVRPSDVAATGEPVAPALVRAWLADAETRRALGVNTWQGEEWLSEEGVAWTVTAASVLDRLDERDIPAVDAAALADLPRQASVAGWRVAELVANLGSPGGAATSRQRPLADPPPDSG